ncbi:hypothetical protein PILCRDRAFT_14194 [Piloderma croceum F 1598]|uniref:Uncharacterized protein n=1 Tax=Piloderma croceum (strain F 1598) TaxID=765440 RepID=A0A0C3EQB9_PILCF|nr:hypothetical protein PILCRDRAFT_14194 [Piloderma croceum F 1598]
MPSTRENGSRITLDLGNQSAGGNNTSSANPYGSAEWKGYTFCQNIISATFTAFPTPSIFIFRRGREITKRREQGGGKEEGGLQQIHSPPDRQYPIDSTRIADVVIQLVELAHRQRTVKESGAYLDLEEPNDLACGRKSSSTRSAKTLTSALVFVTPFTPSSVPPFLKLGPPYVIHHDR